MLPAFNPLARLSSVYNLKMGERDEIHISFYRSAGDRSLTTGISICGIMSKLGEGIGKNEGSAVNSQE